MTKRIGDPAQCGPGWLRRAISCDHKTIGIQYGITALVMLFVAFCFVLLMRWQLAYPGQPIPMLSGLFGENDARMPGGIMLPNFYNQLGAMHGTFMVFLAVVPLLVGGFGTYLVPLMVGAPNLAFPRLSRAGYLCYLGGILVIGASFLTELGPANSGWTAYPPLATIELGGQTYWLVGIALVYVSSLFLAINIITTVVQLRTEGLTLMRLPFFVWGQLVTAYLLLLACLLYTSRCV